jgi:hypothetical protein
MKPGTRAEEYRKRVHELRTFAQDYIHEREKMETLLWLARDYEKMAEGTMSAATVTRGPEPRGRLGRMHKVNDSV